MNWILRNARIADNGPLVDIALEADRIAGIEPAGSVLLMVEAANSRDLEGRVILPGLVDAHVHLDKTYSTLENESGTLLEAIDVWHRARESRGAADYSAAAAKAIQAAIANGVTAMRSHIDIGTPDELAPVEALLALREQFGNQIDLQFVTLGRATQSLEEYQGMVAALELGIDYVGGVPHLCPDPKAEIDAIFALAQRTGKPIDLHMDETENPAMISLEYLAEQTIAHGMQGQVTAGHCCSLAFVDEETAKRVIDKVAEAGIHIITLPSCNLVLMGRQMTPTPRGTTRVKELLAAVVNVSAASDNVHDPFNPFGNHDLLQIANLNAHLAHMTGLPELSQSLDMVTGHPAACMDLDDYGVAVGNRADLVVLDCRERIEAVLAPPPRLATFKAGKLVVETEIRRRWS